MTLKDFISSMKKAGFSFRLDIKKGGEVFFHHYRYNIIFSLYKKNVVLITKEKINFAGGEWCVLLDCTLENICSIERFKDFLKIRTNNQNMIIWN